MFKLKTARALEAFRVELVFTDGTRGIADLSDLAGHGVFQAWADPAVFRDVRIGPSGELVWPGQLDLCPDALYLRITGKKAEDVFPSLRHEPSHA